MLGTGRQLPSRPHLAACHLFASFDHYFDRCLSIPLAYTALICVEITLCHHACTAGPDAYQHDRFGDRVTIERRITKTTSSNWRLLNARGQNMGIRKRGDIDPLLDHFSINSANPLAVMTQDTARTFLSGEQGWLQAWDSTGVQR
jgi:hypothetical protein